MPSAHPSNTDVVIAFYEAFVKADLAAYDQLLSEDWINHPADPGRENNREGFKGACRTFMPPSRGSICSAMP